MARAHRLVTVIAVAAARSASAQPADPYAQRDGLPPQPAQPAPTAKPAPKPLAPVPRDPYSERSGFDTPGPLAQAAPPVAAQAAPPQAPAPLDPVLAERIAGELVERAVELMNAHKLTDAKQLAVEAVITSPNGPAAERARAIIHDVNRALGIPEKAEPPPIPTPPPQPDPPPPPPSPEPSPAPNPTAPPSPTPTPAPTVTPLPEGGPSARTVAQVHTGLYTSLLGAMIGSVIDDPRDSAAPTVIGGLAAGGAGGMYLGPILDRHLTEAQIRTIGSGTIWGGVIGGLMADITTGVGNDGGGTSPRQVLIGASIGATAGGLGGFALSRQDQLTRGDVALVDTLAGIGTFAGFSIGFLMQPAQSEAYDLNAVIGATAGVVTGLVAAPKTHTPQRRMLKVAEYAGIGGGAPYLLLAAIYSSAHASADERLVGALSTAGLGFGTWLGFHQTANLDYSDDATDKEKPSDAPPAIVGRSSDGGWSVGAPGVLPLSRQLDNRQSGAGLTLLSGAF